MMKNYDYTRINIGGQTIANHIQGEGDPLVMLHGWGANIGLLLPLADHLRHYRCHLLDLPGFGASEPPAQAWTVYDYADFVIAYLDEHQLENVYLFGHSFGGRLGLILGARYPQRLLKMALSDAAGIRPKTSTWSDLRLKTYKRVRNTLKQVGLGDLSDTLRDKYNQRYASTDFQDTSGIMRQIFVKVVNEDLLPLAHQVQTSTLLFWGDRDQDTPLWMGQKLAQVIPDAGLVIHEEAGHYAYLEKAADTAYVMDYFFKND